MIDLDQIERLYKQAEEDEVEFVPDEEEYGNTLAASAAGLVALALPIFDQRLNGAVTRSDDVLVAMESMAQVLDDVQDVSVDKELAVIVNNTILRGSTVSGAGDIINIAHRKDIIRDKVVASTKYYSNRYFNDQVIPAVMKNVDKILKNKEFDSRLAFNEIRKMLEDRYKSVPYWHLVANQAVSRGYHYGFLKGGQYAGKTIVRYVSVIDNRTTDLCRNLNGKEWYLADALVTAERRALAEGDELKNINPWMEWEDVKHLEDRDLLAMGVVVPPNHARCRSTLDLY